MKKLGLNEIREKYLSFFESKRHLRLPSFSLVPQNDASVLIINSGMAPLKPYFTGKEEPPRKRVTSCQKCIRTPDIENVGKTARHGTFFEMLGNFSFGDYFKKEAIPWAWEFVTKVLELPEDRLWITVYLDDDEAFEIWNKDVGIKEDRIVRMGKEDNFWEIGTGPCGPCSEIYFDRGADKGCGKPDCSVGCNCDRFMEFWNLVFTQFDRNEKGEYNRLAKPNIDTGMGLERMAAIMQEVNSLFEVDTVRSILDYVANKAGKKYGEDYKIDVALRVITDHVRGTTFMISDGIIPSNEGRGYILRRLIRRAARQGRIIGLEKPFLYEVAKILIDNSKEAYKELAEKEEYIRRIIKSEEERFGETVEQGICILNDYINQLKSEGKTVLSGDKAFKLYDTYGFPPELTQEILSENGMEYDEKEFKASMEQQKEMGRASWQGDESAGWNKQDIQGLNNEIKSKFIGYDSLRETAKVTAVVKDNKVVQKGEKGEHIAIVLDTTPFYAQSGGQVGDQGHLSGDGFKVKVSDTVKTGDNKVLHIGLVEEGSIAVGANVNAEVELVRRNAIMRNHSATHLLQKALREVLGDHVAQAGSLVEPERLRFDFNHFTAMTPQELEKVERRVNESILEGYTVTAEEMGIDKAKKMGATALFGEKYGEKVRLVSMGNYSLELCGGCHVKNTSQVGLFKIVSESGISAGVRRIEAITGLESINYLKGLEEKVGKIADILKTNPQEVVKRTETILAEMKQISKENETLKGKMSAGISEEILDKAIAINGFKVVACKVSNMDIEELRGLGDKLKSKVGSGVIVLAGDKDNKVTLIIMASKDAIEKGIHSGNILKEIAKIVGGGGGGRPDMAQAGGKDTTKIDAALDKAKEIIGSFLE